MLRTIMIGNSLQVQGTSVGTSTDGRLMIKDGDKIFVGRPVPHLTAGKSYQQVNASA